jgi:hypothetical protein
MVIIKYKLVLRRAAFLTIFLWDGYPENCESESIKEAFEYHSPGAPAPAQFFLNSEMGQQYQLN